jgi:hypothetical protein
LKTGGASISPRPSGIITEKPDNVTLTNTKIAAMKRAAQTANFSHSFFRSSGKVTFKYRLLSSHPSRVSTRKARIGRSMIWRSERFAQ